jgi:hypothetical protein
MLDKTARTRTAIFAMELYGIKNKNKSGEPEMLKTKTSPANQNCYFRHGALWYQKQKQVRRSLKKRY